jgi:hypothetical protein
VHLVPHPIAARTESFDAGAQCMFLALQALERLSPEPFFLEDAFDHSGHVHGYEVPHRARGIKSKARRRRKTVMAVAGPDQA